MEHRRYGVAAPEQVRGKTGLEFLRALISGELPQPPIAETLGFELVEAREGFAAFEGDTSARLLNPAGVVHGGFALTLLDSVTACAAQTLLPAGSGYTTVETKVNFVRPIRADAGRVRAEATVIAAGRTIMTAEGRLKGPDGKLLAHGTSTLIVLPS